LTPSIPEIAVVIPTRFREARLSFALDALARQSVGPERFEIIVVRAPDAVGGRLTEAPPGLTVRFMTAPVASPGVQRNVGWRSSSAPLIAFTDDDCRPAPEWLERMLEASSGPETVLQGRTEPDPAERHLWWGLARSWEITEENEYYATCNIAYPRRLLEHLEGFDDRYPGKTAICGEDTDLGLRARELGAELRYVDGALVWHAVLQRSLRAALREARRRDATALVVKRHPAHRQALYKRYFVHPRHPAMVLALAGALALRRQPVLGAAMTVPYLHVTVGFGKQAPRRMLGALARLPARAAVDLAEVLITARSAIRNRVVLL